MVTSTIGDRQIDFTSLLRQVAQENQVETPQSQAGVAGAGGAVPSPEANGSGAGAAYIAAFSTLFASSTLAPSRRGDMEVVLAEVSAALKDTRDRVEGERINTLQEKIRASQNEQQEKLTERTEKIEESLAKQKKRRIGGIFSRIFQAVALALTAAVAGLMFATGVGAPLGTALVLAMVIQAYQLTDGITADVTGMGTTAGLAQRHANAKGLSEEEVAKRVAKVESGVNYALLAASLTIAAVTIGATLSGYGVTAASKAAQVADEAVEGGAQAAGAAGGAVSKSADVAVDVADEVAKSFMDDILALLGKPPQQPFSEFAETVMLKLSLAEGVNTVAEASVNSVVTNFTRDAQNLQADAEKLKAEADVMSAHVLSVEDMIDEAFKLLMQSQDATAAMLDAATAALKDRNASLGRVRFAG